MSGTNSMPHPLRPRACAFLTDVKGLAAVELALILPIALMLMSLVVFGGQAFGVQRRVTVAASTVANIFAQANNINTSTITAPEITQILAYPNLILYPYNGSGAAVVVSQLQSDQKREWNRNRHGPGQLRQRQWNSPAEEPAIIRRSVDRRRLF
jgi:Flp pilus assembly protein TadG